MPTALKLTTVQGNSLPIPGVESWHVTAKDPAMLVMTDFHWHSSVTVSENSTIDAALDHMKHTGVRCAFVIDGKMSAVVGMITAYDISGEKPVQHMRLTSTPRNEILVKDIMQKMADWHVANLKDIESATVAEVLKVFTDSDVTHIPVMEKNANNEQRLRGLLSFAKVKRLLVA
ncbi:MAG: CBS domain-containing protein [Gallionella sp.]|nr:CBS domain-containing protein [Gallionella sp.]